MPESPYNTEDLPQIRAGVARSVITPEGDVRLAGYYHERIGGRVRDDLHCRALVLEHDDCRICIVTLDLIFVARTWGDQARALITERTGIPADRILISATHTHTGPSVSSSYRWSAPEEWVASLPEKIADTAEAAAGDMFDALLFLGAQEECLLASNRLGRTRDADEVFSSQGVIGHAGPVDPELVAIGVREPDGTVRAVMVNYGMHVDVIGGGTADFVSADWPGIMEEAVAGIYGEQAITVFVNGPCGDINHRLWRETRQPGEGEAKAIQMGRTYAGLAVAAVEVAEPMEETGCGSKFEDLQIPYYTRDEAIMAEIEAMKQRDDLEYFEEAIIKSYERWDKDGQIAQVPVQVMRFGELMIVGLPGEIFTKWGMEIKHWSPTPWTIVVELANDALGYIPTTDQASRGGYGAKPILSRRLIADAGRQISDWVQTAMWEIWEGEDRPTERPRLGEGGSAVPRR
jgi:neutral ceramidase